ncbi:MAG: RdgB/HAM1 family non-canonical purine NTP pyrophosphatase [Clostridiales bacterium]|jgi:XTP/dITP diphosphohydrolase|nr:RdgB/HAM1 family non-canonical purine NTP pyrophosphatase [Clostridiales bacterium]
MMTKIKDIVFATRNAGKIREVKKFFANSIFGILSLDEAGIDIHVIEDGATFEENAAKKAREICRKCEKIVLADDSGLMIDALDGAPGVDSANFLGADTPYAQRNAKILEMLANVPEDARAARFVCVIAIARPGQDIILQRTELHGQIAYAVTGQGGFGYDPIFFLPKYGITMAQMDVAQKNEISHRGQALRLVRSKLEEVEKL